MAPNDVTANALDPYWMPFTANRAFKARPRLFDRRILLPELLYERVVEANERFGAHGERLQPLDEAALSGSSRALLPVVSIAGQTVGDGRPGPIVGRVLAAYNAFVAENVRTAM